MRILVISKYPTPSSPQQRIFVYNLVKELVSIGHGVTVISPKKITITNILRKHSFEDGAVVHQPLFLSCSSKQIGPFNTYFLTHRFTVNAIRRVMKKINISYDIVYCHFWESGFVASDAIQNPAKPFIVSFGDSTSQYMNTLALYSSDSLKKLLFRIWGFVSVSEENTKLILKQYSDPPKILLAPNGVDNKIFYPRDKRLMRQKYGIPLNSKIVIYVGGFNESKGFNRVLCALSDLSDVKGIFIGNGRIRRDYGKIVYKGKVKHYEVAEILSCADLFVLPTRSEGSCNAIVEAMTCGLPIISSNIPSVKEQCKPSFSILVDPNSIEEIRDAISSIIFDSSRLSEMGRHAILHSNNYKLSERAMKISLFLKGFSDIKT